MKKVREYSKLFREDNILVILIKPKKSESLSTLNTQYLKNLKICRENIKNSAKIK